MCLGIVRAVSLRLHQKMSHPSKPAHIAFCVARFGRLMLVYLLIGFYGLVYECLRLGLEEKHLYVLLGFLGKYIVPLGHSVVIAESLAVLTVHLLTLLLFLFLGAGEIL